MSDSELNSNALFCKVRAEHEAAQCRKLSLIRDSQDARLKAEVVEEYEWKLRDIMDAIKKNDELAS